MIVVSDACTACGACLATCPTRALRAAPRRPSVDMSRCTACLDCVEICPRGAIAEVTSDEEADRWRRLAPAPIRAGARIAR